MLLLDHDLSKRYRTPVLLLKTTLEPALLRELCSQETYWQEREGKNSRTAHTFAYYRLRPLYSFATLQKLACSQKILYREKALIFDFFTPLTLEFLAEGMTVSAFVTTKKNSWQAQESDLILQGAPHIIIKEQFVRFTHPDISWQTLERAAHAPFTLTKSEYVQFKEDLKDEKLELVEFTEDEKPPAKVLELVDSTLGFAHLAVRTKEYESELLRAGFIYKPMGNSNFFCPLDRTEKAICTLLEHGWEILDVQKRSLVAPKEPYVHVESGDAAYLITGTLSFGRESVPLSRCIEAFFKKEKLLPLGNNHVGLLSLNALPTLATLLPHVELVSDALSVKKHDFGVIQEVLDAIDCPEEVASELSGKQEYHPPQRFSGTLRPYQELGVAWMQGLFARSFSGLLADEMGLGKTVQVLAFLATLPQPHKTLIVVPTSLLYNWKHEIATFLPHATVAIFHGTERTLQDADITLTSYGIVRSDQALLSTRAYTALIVDEAHTMKNKETLTFQALNTLKARFRLSLTGTPVENSLSELLAHFQFLQPGLLDASCTSIQAVRAKIRPFLLRRKKSDVAKELPEKVEEVVYVTMSPLQKEFYYTFLQSVKQGLIQKISIDGLAKHRMELFEAILRLRQIACHPQLVPQLMEGLGYEASLSSAKCDAVLDDVETLIGEGKKVVVFSQFATMLALLATEAKARRWNYLLLDGKTTARQELVDRFQNDPNYPLFFISLKAGGVGLNLTRADYVLLYDPWWNRSQELQAIDRAHRIGRKETVFAKRYVVVDSIEEKILELQAQKSELVEKLMEDSADGTTPILDTLLESYFVS